MPTIKPSLYHETYKLQQENRPVFQFDTCYIIPSTKFLQEPIEEAQAWFDKFVQHNRIETWNEYATQRYAYYVVTASDNFYRCTCLQGSKKSICEHAVWMMISDGLLQYPDEVTAAPLETRHRKRGRPKKAGPALNME
jgi:hypothetical protein